METKILKLRPPTCLVGGPVDDAASDKELLHLVRIQLDLIEEGQDGTEGYSRREVTAIKQWLRNPNP